MPIFLFFLFFFCSLYPSFAFESSLAMPPEKLMQSLEEHIHIHPEGPNLIGYIKVDERDKSINQSTWIYVKKALDQYKKTQPIFIILELNTPGGEVLAAQQISDGLNRSMSILAFQ